MFDFLLSEEKKMRRHAANWLEVAERVYHFRRDLLPAAQVQQLVAATGDLKLRLKDKADASKLKIAIEKLEDVLRQTGGRIYPTSSLVENVEFLLVAAIVILGLRAYFVQPFKIPTNSMWPTYYGMTHELIRPGEEHGTLAQVGRFLAFGATHYELKAPADGEVMVPVVPYTNGEYGMPYSIKPGRMLGVIPTTRREYTFFVDGTPVRLETPGDFGFERVLDDAFGFGKPARFGAQLREQIRLHPAPETATMYFSSGGREHERRINLLPIGKKVRKGETIVSFDILTGDLLFVDRVTYNFFPPKVGQGFVFKTENIDAPDMKDRNTGEQIRQYYIKRLVGTPGDRLEVRVPKPTRDGANDTVDSAGQLLRNGAPITGADAFVANAERRGLYRGYTNIGLLGVGKVAEVPANNYMAMGDNSPESADSRYWGFVPNKDVVGKPLFIYYPLTRRWGLAK
ncbi:MAG: signal peptidase I [Opitutae bacterium]|nr:signal peptidase I [Opitutae bacterium]